MNLIKMNKLKIFSLLKGLLTNKIINLNQYIKKILKKKITVIINNYPELKPLFHQTIKKVKIKNLPYQ